MKLSDEGCWCAWEKERRETHFSALDKRVALENLKRVRPHAEYFFYFVLCYIVVIFSSLSTRLTKQYWITSPPYTNII